MGQNSSAGAGRSGGFSALDLVLPALFAALIAVCAWISIPGPVSFTLQTLAVFLCAALLGVRRSMASITVYVVLGAIGVPVFAGFSSGLARPTSGYIVGFVFTVLFISLIVRRFGRSFPVLLLSMIFGNVLCYIFGTAWYMIFSANAGNPLTLGVALGNCVIPFLLPDLAKIVVAAILVNRLYPHLRFIR